MSRFCARFCGIAARAAVAHADVQVAVGAEQQQPAVVVRVGLALEQDLARATPRSARFGLPLRAPELLDARVAVAVGEVDVEAAAAARSRARTPSTGGPARRPLVTSPGDVEERLRRDACRRPARGSAPAARRRTAAAGRRAARSRRGAGRRSRSAPGAAWPTRAPPAPSPAPLLARVLPVSIGDDVLPELLLAARSARRPARPISASGTSSSRAKRPKRDVSSVFRTRPSNSGRGAAVRTAPVPADRVSTLRGHVHLRGPAPPLAAAAIIGGAALLVLVGAAADRLRWCSRTATTTSTSGDQVEFTAPPPPKPKDTDGRLALLPLRPRPHRLSAGRPQAAVQGALGLQRAGADGVPARSSSNGSVYFVRNNGGTYRLDADTGQGQVEEPARRRCPPPPPPTRTGACSSARCRARSSRCGRATASSSGRSSSARAPSPRRSCSNGVVYFGTEGGALYALCAQAPAA